jgi:succinate dehydrogenase/fumarate reductase cytochrome b subunit
MIRRLLLFAAIILFILSFTQPAFFTGRADKDAGNTILLFFVGGLGLIADPLNCFAWLANPLFLIAVWLTARRKRRAFVVAVFAVIFAVGFLGVRHVMVNEAGGYADITARKAGYWLWLAATVVLAIATCFPTKPHPASSPAHEPFRAV